jgi:pimeloyl-ACP methyl ester carboxylesterase
VDGPRIFLIKVFSVTSIERRESMNVRRKIIYLILITLLFSGCAYIDLVIKRFKLNFIPRNRSEPEDIKQSSPEKCGVLMGKIIGNVQRTKPIVVVAYSERYSKNRIADYTVLFKPGPYMLYVPEGTYDIVVFEDANGDLLCERDEFLDRFKNAGSVSVEEGQVVGKLDIKITTTGNKHFDYPISLEIPSDTDGKLETFVTGGTVDLESEMFSRKYGAIGLWSPSKFVNELGGSIYALEKYDSSKIPILFVHGSGGTPRDWKYFAENIDRNRYQPWFFYYPSGLRLKTLSDLLQEELRGIYDKYHFKQLYVTAHSMGGLLVRSFINQYVSDNHPYTIKIFISLSTPWGGIDRAKLAPKNPTFFNYPACWKDLASGSTFIESLFRKKLPCDVIYVLFFGYRGDKLILSGADDGTVALKSQLDYRAQSEAIRCFGFNEDHISILFTEEVLRRYKKMLEFIGS